MKKSNLTISHTTNLHYYLPNFNGNFFPYYVYFTTMLPKYLIANSLNAFFLIL